MLARLATSVLIGQEVDCIQRTVQLGPVSSGVVGHLLGLGELCWHNFEHNSSMEAQEHMLA